MAARGPPAAVRRGLTFWRRSIQARVVVSTVVLSAVVVSVVGWFLLQQTRDGLLDHRVDAVRGRGGTTRPPRPSDRLAARPAPTTTPPQHGSCRADHPARRQPRASRWCCSAPPATAAGSPTAARRSRRGSTPPACRTGSAALRRRRRRPPGPTRRSATTPRHGAPPTCPASWSARRSSCRRTGDLHALLPLPAGAGAARRSRWSPGRC